MVIFKFHRRMDSLSAVVCLVRWVVTTVVQGLPPGRGRFQGPFDASPGVSGCLLLIGHKVIPVDLDTLGICHFPEKIQASFCGDSHLLIKIRNWLCSPLLGVVLRGPFGEHGEDVLCRDAREVTSASH